LHVFRPGLPVHLLEQHWLLAVHVAPIGPQGGAVQTPFTHVCPTGQVIGVNTQPVAALQLSVVQALPSLQVMAVCEQTPPEQLSVVHALPSLQLIGACTQVPDTHVSTVHAFASSHSALVVQVGAGRARLRELITSIRP